MANIKTIALVSGGVAVAFVAIIGMNIAASTKDDEGFSGGVSAQKLPRQLPESNADPFQVISDEDEAARRATSNRLIAEEEIRKTGDVPAYTAPPVIQLEGSSGDSFDPMAAALVDQDERPAPEALDQAVIEPVKPPEREYKVPETPPSVAATALVDPTMDAILRRALVGNTPHGVSIQTFNTPEAPGRAPMTLQEFKRSNGGQAGGTAGLPVSRLPEPAASTGTALPDPAPKIKLPEQSSDEGGSVLRTIDPNSPSSYIEGALQNAIAGGAFASLSRKHDVEYDWRKPYQIAQSAVGIDNNSRIYDTSRNAMAFDTGSLMLPGDQRYATLMYGFNSDDAAQIPVFAQLHDYSPASSAFLNGARVQGTLRLSNESAVMEFDKLILQDGRVVPIQAMGISQDQLRVGVFKNVNRHVLSRYSSLLVSGLIKGVGDVGTRIIENKYDSSDNVIIIGDGTTTNPYADDTFSDADRAAIAMGAMKPIGDEMASAAAQGFGRKPTVTAPAGYGLSIVFIEGLTFGQVQ